MTRRRRFRQIWAVGLLMLPADLSREVFAADPCDEPCAADPSWVTSNNRPTYAKPNPDEDCDFYQPAWQSLLYLIQEATPGDGPRLLTLDTPEDLFGHSPATRFPKGKKGTLRLAPRLGLSKKPLTAEEFQQAVSQGVLVDPFTGRAVYYAVHFNDVFAKFIRDNGYNDILTMKNAPPDQEYPRGSLETKSSWRILADNDKGDGFITASATLSLLKPGPNGKIVIDPAATETKRVALAGIHVVFALDGHPEFIWATFEHKDNAPDLNCAKQVHTPAVGKEAGIVPDMQPVDDKRDWTFYQKGAAGSLCNKNNHGTLTLTPPQQLSPVVNVFRQFPFGNDDNSCTITTLNDSVHTAIDGALATMPDGDAKVRLAALKNYDLRGAMWLNNPAYFRENVTFGELDEAEPTKQILGGDKQLSNATIETFTQTWTGGPQNSTFCFDCHTTTQKQLHPPIPNGPTFPALRLGISQTIVQRYLHTAEAAAATPAPAPAPAATKP